MSTAVNFHSPVGELQWVFITGKGKKDLNDKDRYVASVVLEGDAAELLKSQIEEFWEENQPKGTKQVKSLGFKPELDPEGNETGRISFNFWTGIEYPDGSAKTIKIYNAKGAEVSLGQKRIGNGSVGRIGGAMDIYNNGPAARGVTLYLNSIQLKKFKEYSGGDNFDAIDDDDDDAFEGFDDGMPPFEADNTEEAPKPRL